MLVSSIIGLALGATVVLIRVLPPWIAIALVTVFAIGPLAVVGRTELGHTAGRTLWEWAAVGGATVQASYHIDPLAVTAAAAVAVATAVAMVASRGAGGPIAPALLALLGIALIALCAVTDVVVAAIVAGASAALAVAAALFVAPQAAAARLAALLALGVQSLIASALLLARAGAPSFELDDIARGAISSSVVLAAVLGAALFGGLYPFVPWRYERSAAEPRTPLSQLRGLALFPTAVAGTVVAFRIIAASGLRPDELRLPDISVEAHAAILALVVVAGAIAVRAAPREAFARRSLAAGAFVAAAIALPYMSVAHVMTLIALLTIVYATVASTALVEEWAVARFDVRIAVVWAALASGSAPALAASLFGLVASSVALVIESATPPGAAGAAIAASARLLNLVGPFLAVAGVAFASDPIAGALAGVVLAWAALLELGHAVRESGTHPAGAIVERAFSALVAVAVVFVVSLVASLPATAAAVDVLGPLPAEALDLVLVALTLLAVALAVLIVALPGTIRARIGARGMSLLRRVLLASDPVPALALAYRGVEAWSERIGSSFATLEDRAGVWLATALIALALIWAATT